MSERVDVQQLRDQIDWYRRCLENAYLGVAVRGLAEARAGYESALPALLARLDALEEVAEKAREDWRDRFEVSYTEAARGFLRGFTVCEVELAKALDRLREGKA